MILNPNGTFPYTHRLYFAVGLPSIYFTEAEALSALQAYDPQEWAVQSADLLGDYMSPKRARIECNEGSWYMAYPSERDPSRLYPFAGGFEDRAHLERWTPFVQAVHTILKVAKAGKLDEPYPGQAVQVTDFEGTIKWDLLQFVPVSEKPFVKAAI